MKKEILSCLLVLFICLALVGCGNEKSNNEDVKIENKVNLSLDKKIYQKEERIEVTLDFGKLSKDDATIVITKSSTKHDDEKYVHDENNHTEYRYISDFSEIPFYMWAPNSDGKYDVRVYENNNGGKELASVSFEVNVSGETDTNKKDDDKPDENNNTTGCKKINQEHMIHFEIPGFDIESSYCIYEYDYRDYVDSLKIYFVADTNKQLDVAGKIFNLSRSYESLNNADKITNVSDAKYWADESYKFHNGNYLYEVHYIDHDEEDLLSGLMVKKDSVYIIITPHQR